MLKKETELFPFYTALLLSVLFLVAYWIFGYFGWQPSSQSLSMIGKMSVWCERVTGGIFREPANALSNLGFMIIGLSMFYVLSKEKTDSTNGNAFFGITPVSTLYLSLIHISEPTRPY